MKSHKFDVGQGAVRIFSVSNGVLKADDWAEILAGKILSVADTAPEPIRQQALAVQNEMRQVIRTHVLMIRKEMRARDIHLLRTNGYASSAIDLLEGDK
jgi:hypothetical protein